MLPVLTASEMKQCDNATIHQFGVPSLVLMERAALACAREITDRFSGSASKRTLIVAGTGNNGGDGLAIGRLLKQAGFPVDFLLVGNPEHCSMELQTQAAIVRNYGWEILDQLPQYSYDIIVDAIFGIGLHSDIRGSRAEAIAYINHQNAYVLSVDIPSGIHADTGAVCGIAVRADRTVALAALKPGLLLYPGASYAGEVVVKDIGITTEGLTKSPRLFTSRNSPPFLLPSRRTDGNKGTFGKVLLIAGSRGMSGAAVLSASAVLKSGAGMVRVLTEEGNRVILQSLVPEAMGSFYDADTGMEEETFAAIANWADVIAIGPGIGKGNVSRMLLSWTLSVPKKPIIMDADAINLLREPEDETLLHLLISRQTDPSLEGGLVLTPHAVEFARLSGLKREEVLASPVPLSAQWADKLHAAMVLKGACSVVASPEGTCYLNQTGNSGMATAGSGDVLTGIIAGLLAQGMGAYEAACTGVWLHGTAGDAAAQSSTEYCVMAMDLVHRLPEAIMAALSERKESNGNAAKNLGGD